MKPWYLVREPSLSPRGSSAGTHTPRRRPVCSQLRFLSCVRIRSALSPTTALNMEPPSAQSPFAGGRRYRHPRDVYRLLRGRYSPVIAPTDSCVDPIRLSSPSAEASFEKSLQVATSPCCRRDPPDVISVNPSLVAWAHATAVPRSAHACCFLHVIGLLPFTIEVGFPLYPSKRFRDGSLFRDCSHSFMFRPPSLLASQIVPTAAIYPRRAAEVFTSEQNMLRCLRMHRIS